MANFEPVTRIEMLLSEIAENTSGGGGGSDIFVVNFTQGEHGAVSADKTVEEIAAAAEAGKTLVAKVYYYIIDRIVTTVDVRASHPDQHYSVDVWFKVIVPASYYDDPPEGDVLHNVYIYNETGGEGWFIEHTDYLMASYGE